MATRDPDLFVEAGSFEPVYWMVVDPATGNRVDLTEAGFEVSGTVADRDDGTGTTLVELTDADFRRTDDGRLFFQPLSTTTAAWTWRRGFGQFVLATPDAGKSIRFWSGRIHNSPVL